MKAQVKKPKSGSRDAMDRLVVSFMALLTRELRKRGKPNGYVKASTAVKWLTYGLAHPMELEEKLQYGIVKWTHPGNTFEFSRKLGAAVYGEIVADWKKENKALIAEIILLRRNQ